MHNTFKRQFSSAILIIFLSIPSFWGQSNGFEVVKNMELMDLIFQHLDLYYVENPQHGKLAKAGFDAMLRELDPYTVFYHENNIEDYRLMTTGQYGGVGALIRKMDESVYFVEPYEGSPAQKSGVRAGDRIISIDGKNLESASSDEVSSALKGPKGSVIKVEIERLGKRMMLGIERDEIKLPDVPYSGMVSNGIGYVKLNSFTQTAASDVKKAFLDLKSQGMKSFVLDLRGNGGGLLIEAVKIVNMFVKKGQLVVTTKGRIPEENHTYLTTENPLDLEIPVAILIDENSASASEIVAGTLQDLDRAVIIGSNSFGKGLVQRTYDLKYGSKMKLTIAKYYTPSGRCVQRLDYSEQGSFSGPQQIPDSLIKIFKTQNGRKVVEGRGIEPDVEVEKNTLSNLTAMLYTNDVIFNFASDYVQKHESIAPALTFNITDADYQLFMEMALKKDFEYTTESVIMLNKLKETAEEEGYYSDIDAEYQQILQKVTPSKSRDLKKFQAEISELIENEIVSRYYYQKGRMEHSFQDDPCLEKAKELMSKPGAISAILQ